MKPAKQVFINGRTGFTVGLAAVSAATISLVVLLVASGTAQATVAVVPLGTSGSFAVLAGTGITNTGTTTINGNIGSYPTGSETGFASLVLNGTNYPADTTSQVAQNDLVTAYNDAAAEGPTTAIAGGTLGVETLTPGVYNSGSTIQLNGPLTLNGNNNPNSVFVFQAGSGLTTASASQVILENGAQACNVFWQVGSSATLGSGSSFQGTILASASVTLGSSAVVSGRLLAHTGDVTLISNTVTVPTCISSVVTTTTTTTVPASTTTTSASTTTTGAGPTAGPTTTTSPATAPATITVPPTNTGKPWAGWPWWTGTAILGVGGIALMVPWKMKRSIRRQR
ncbi:MAG: DUF3494 domain-containing protein [Actinomycetota bacterium]|nr:MAG: DUF3494 domain-containing protein [Actinomycetota bacterium]